MAVDIGRLKIVEIIESNREDDAIEYILNEVAVDGKEGSRNLFSIGDNRTLEEIMNEGRTDKRSLIDYLEESKRGPSLVRTNSKRKTDDGGERYDSVGELVDFGNYGKLRKTGSVPSTPIGSVPSTPGSSIQLTPAGKDAQRKINNLNVKKRDLSDKAALRQWTRKDNMLKHSGLSDFLFGMTKDRIYNCVTQNIDIYKDKLTIHGFERTPPSDRTFSADFSKAVSWNRNAEKGLAPRRTRPIDQQCYYSIGKPISEKTADMNNQGVMGSIGLPRTDKNFKQWDCHYCWLCSLPLWVGGEKPQCEHKLPILEMVIFGAGLAGSVDEQANIIASQKQSSTITRKSFSQEWKNLMRGEAYGWSHTWCNMYKNQLPFMTLRSIEIRNEKDNSVKYKTFPFMEMNTIYSYVEQSFINTFFKNALKTEFEGSNHDLRSVTTILRQHFNVKYGLGLKEDYFDNVEIRNGELVDVNGDKSMIYKRKSRNIDVSIFDVPDVLEHRNVQPGENVIEKLSKLIPLLEQSFEGIVQSLAPTILYMTSGSDVPKYMKDKRDRILGRRSMFYDEESHIGGGGIDNYSVVERAKDNYERYAIKLLQDTIPTAVQPGDVQDFITFLKTPYSEEGTKERIAYDEAATAVEMAHIFKTTIGKIEEEEEKKKDDQMVMEEEEEEEEDGNKIIGGNTRASIHMLVKRDEIDLKETLPPNVDNGENELAEEIKKLSQEINPQTITNESHNEFVRTPSIGGPLPPNTPMGSRQNSIVGSPPRNKTGNNARRRFEPEATPEEIAERNKITEAKKTGMAKDHERKTHFSSSDDSRGNDLFDEHGHLRTYTQPDYVYGDGNNPFDGGTTFSSSDDELGGGKKKKRNRKRKTKKKRKKRKRTKRKKKKKKTKKRRKRKRKTRRKGRRKS